MHSVLADLQIDEQHHTHKKLHKKVPKRLFGMGHYNTLVFSFIRFVSFGFPVWKYFALQSIVQKDIDFV